MARTAGWLAIGLAAAAAWQWTAWAQAPLAGPAGPSANVAGVGSRELITNFTSHPNGSTALTVIDPQARAVAVYHIARENGEIQLMSVRNIAGDMTLRVFNGSGLSPDDIQKMVQGQQ